MKNHESHQKVLNESSYKNDYEICAREESYKKTTYFTGFFRDHTGGWPREWTFNDKLDGNNPDCEYIYLRPKRRTCPACQSTVGPFPAGYDGRCDDCIPSILKESPHWVATLVVRFMDGSSIHHTYTSVEKDVAWNRLMTELRTADQSSDVDNWNVSITRTPLSL